MALWVFEQGLERSPKKQPYRHHHLDLEDILKTYGQQLMGPPLLKLWPENLATSGAIRYGTDSEYTFRLHQEHHDWGSFGSTETCGVDFKDIDRLIQGGVLRPDTLTTWKNALAPLYQSGFARGRRQPGSTGSKNIPPVPEIRDISQSLSKGLLQAIYGATVLFIERVSKAKQRW